MGITGIAKAFMNEISEIKLPEVKGFKMIKPESDITLSDAKNFVEKLFEKLFNETNDGFYTDYKDRSDRMPVNSENGTWEGEPGESKFIPSDKTEKGRAAIDKLSEYGMNGIEYNNCEPDYSKCCEATVQIDNMTASRYKNFDQADKKLAEQWSNEKKFGQEKWTDEDIEKYRKENHLSWHERCDTKTMDLVSRDIHGGDTSVFLHSGGVAECKARDEKNIGGGFDE